MTTNRSVTEWAKCWATTIAVALLDRLLHRSVVIDLTGASYRLRNHHARNNNIRRAIQPTTS
jgi:DNA replication protein DnaC